MRGIAILETAGRKSGQSWRTPVGRPSRGFTVSGAGPMRRAICLLRPDGREPAAAERALIETLRSCCAASVAGCVA